ncbi:MAG: discoidin domain-containing protein [Bacteroidia bacterium]|nr:discoidin domain-containing protein [Bacteroidia bacterium]
MKKIISTLFLLFVILIHSSYGQFVNRTAAPLTLTYQQLIDWTPTGSTADSRNVSTVPLAQREYILASQLTPNLNFDTKVDWCPDGADRWTNYMGEVDKFNTYNFTNWSLIDKFTWFSNAANAAFIPPRPLVEAAHKNGVKVFGTLMFGSNADGYISTLVQQQNGVYIGAQRMYDIAKYYGFDGWFFNVESSSNKVTQLREMMKAFQAIKDSHMEISWYDSLTDNGSLAWQDQLNSSNDGFFQEGGQKVSDEFFTNYNWTATHATNSANKAVSLGRSKFDVFMGCDPWPNRGPQNPYNNPNFINNLYGKTSMALYAWGNLIYEPVGHTTFMENPNDWFNYYNAEARFFAGDDMNHATTNASGWKGISNYVPVRTTINSLPFETSFNVGQGKIWAVKGVQTTRNWSDMSKQSILPTWMWAITGSAAITPRLDLDLAYDGGASIKISGNINNNDATIKLYQTKLALVSNSQFDLTYKAEVTGATNLKLMLYFSDALTSPVELPLPNATGTSWETHSFSLAPYAGRELAVIGVKVGSTSSVNNYVFHLGKMKIFNSSGGVAPGIAVYQSPANGAANVDLQTTLSWTAGASTFTHDVYFGTTSTPPLVGNQTTNSYETPTLNYNTTYYWRVNEKNDIGVTEGPVWSFTTKDLAMPGQATNPTPANGANSILPTASLNWTGGSDATSRDVYFGTTNPPAFIGNQTGTTYAPTLNAATTYYWQINEKNAKGTTSGQVWSFTTSNTIKVDRTDSGGTITVRGENSAANEGKDKAFDNNTSTKWLDFSSSSWIQYQFANNNAYAISEYTITSANDYPTRDPKAWVLKGSNDGSNWTTLDTRSNVSFTSRFQKLTFTFSNTTAYKYYRFDNITNGGASEIQLAEIELIEYAAAPAAPGAATLPNPASGTTGVSPANPALTWTAGNNATSHDVYFGTSNPPTLIGNQASTSYSPGNLSANTTYYWQINEKNSTGTTTGTVWNFTTGNVQLVSQNVALGKTATASSVESGTSFTANLAVDGVGSTRWASGYTNAQWISIDLQNTYTINRVVLKWEAAYGKDFRIEISSNGTTWTTVKTVTGNTALTNDYTGLSATGRYLRIYGVTRGTQWGYSLWEIEAYADVPANTSTTRSASLESPQSATENAPLINSFKIYPNPTKDIAYISYYLPESNNVEISVYNMGGSIVDKIFYSQQSAGENIVVLQGNYPEGIYLVHVKVGNNTIVSGKLIVKK